MQTIKPSQLSLSTRCIEFRRRHGLCLTAYVYFPLRPAGPQTLFQEATMWPFVAEQLGANAILDEGIAKTTPEFLVCAQAWPPERPARQCAVRARVGNREKTLVVSGDRYWDHDRPSPAHPFESMPIDWRRAYGGPDHAANPLGLGRQRVVRDGVELLPLPNLELAADPMVKPTQPIQAAAFGPLDPMWAQRASLRGTYDAGWYEQHSPGLAPDTDWRHFNLASADQWFDAPLRGDERFEFDHLHPAKPRVSGVLPGVRVKCFLQRSAASGGRLHPVPMTLTTTWFFPHVERGVLVFHGMCECADEFASDALMLLGAIESIDVDKPDQHYLDALARRADPEMGSIHSLIDDDFLPGGFDSIDPQFESNKAEFDREGLAADAQFRRAELEVKKARSKVIAAGADPDALGVVMPARPRRPTLAELPAYLKQFAAEHTPKMIKALDEAAVDMIKASRLRPGAAATPKPALPAAAAAPIAEGAGPPKFKAVAEIAKVRKALEAMPQASRPTIDFGQLSAKLVTAELAGRGAYLQGAHLQPPHPPMTPEASAKTRDILAANIREKKTLVGANLTGADLSGLDLGGHDLSNAWLENADLSGADLRGTNLSFAVLAHAKLDGVNAQGANFHAANLGHASIQGADFSHAQLNQSVLSNVRFAGATFENANLIGSTLLDAEFDGADWTGVDATGVVFLKRSMKGMRLAMARLDSASFIECDLEGADLSGVQGASINFVTCKLMRARFVGAHCKQSVFVKDCDLTLADFSGAHLAQVNLRGVSMKGACLEGLQADGADLSEAKLDGADLTRARLRDALLVMTEARNTIAIGIDLMGAILTRCDWRGSDLRGANLFGADLSRVVLDATTLTEGANGRRARLHPRAASEASA